MRRLLLVSMLALFLAPALPAVDWTDNGDGTHSVSVTFTVPDAVHAVLEKDRADHNQAHFYSGQERDASAYIQERLEGFVGPRSGFNFAGFFVSWCESFIRRWVPAPLLISSSDRGMTEGAAVTVPAPVAEP